MRSVCDLVRGLIQGVRQPRHHFGLGRDAPVADQFVIDDQPGRVEQAILGVLRPIDDLLDCGFQAEVGDSLFGQRFDLPAIVAVGVYYFDV